MLKPISNNTAHHTQRSDRVIRRLILVAAMVGVAAVSSCTTLTWVALDSILRSDPTFPLTKGLIIRTGDLGPEFDQRIKAAFPLGSSDKAMGLILGRQGFTRRDWTTQPDEEHQASREERGPCDRYYEVYWRSDPQGHLLSIRGKASASCL